MASDVKIVLEHVRTFSKRQSIPLRPLTLLIGENSSGKSTFLSVISAIFDATRFPASPPLNDPPYSLGTFDTIATYKGGKYGRDDTFSIGFTEKDPDDPGYREVVATYRSDYGNAVIARVRAKGEIGSIDMTFVGSKLTAKVTLNISNGEPTKSFEFSRDMETSTPSGVRLLGFFIMDGVLRHMTSIKPEIKPALVDWPSGIMGILSPPFPSCFSSAPIRSKPHRTYDEFSEEYSPEGDHIPTLLRRLLQQESTSSESVRLQRALTRFGHESGLFKAITVKRLGKKLSDPFQIQVAVSGPSFNLTDVGYGVSQALPLIVQSVLKTTSKVLLLQQPEVHLHPKAQAALGTFFAELVANDDRMFVIETHSDFLVDRVRQEVANGSLAPDKVLLLFFAKSHLSTQIWPITIDQHGNVENAPPVYRRFFLEEELKLLERGNYVPDR